MSGLSYPEKIRNQQAVFLVEGKDNEFSSFSVINYLD